MRLFILYFYCNILLMFLLLYVIILCFVMMVMCGLILGMFDLGCMRIVLFVGSEGRGRMLIMGWGMVMNCNIWLSLIRYCSFNFTV